MQMRRSAQKGFTLIELIITIVIIGVLAAVAIPKFQDLSNDAEKGVAAGVASSLASALSVNYAKSKAPNPVACSATVTTNCFYTITSCSDVNTNRNNLADIPTGYTVTGTLTGLAGTGTAVASCTVQNTAGTATATFSIYAAT